MKILLPLFALILSPAAFAADCSATVAAKHVELVPTDKVLSVKLVKELAPGESTLETRGEKVEFQSKEGGSVFLLSYRYSIIDRDVAYLVSPSCDILEDFWFDHE